jgi:hypothetical protein
VASRATFPPRRAISGYCCFERVQNRMDPFYHRRLGGCKGFFENKTAQGFTLGPDNYHAENANSITLP